jgi:hypothetical protein
MAAATPAISRRFRISLRYFHKCFRYFHPSLSFVSVIFVHHPPSGSAESRRTLLEVIKTVRAHPPIATNCPAFSLKLFAYLGPLCGGVRSERVRTVKCRSQVSRGGEPRHSLGGHLYRAAVLRIANPPRFAMRDTESAEPRDRYAVTFLEARLDAFENGIQRARRLGPGEACIRGDLTDEVSLVHGDPQCPQFISNPDAGVNDFGGIQSLVAARRCNRAFCSPQSAVSCRSSYWTIRRSRKPSSSTFFGPPNPSITSMPPGFRESTTRLR